MSYKNKERRSKYNKEYRQNHKEEDKERHQKYHKEYYPKNKEKLIKISKEWYEKNNTPERKYLAYLKNCERLNRKIEISLGEYKEIVSRPCSYCGTNERMGMDRVDSSKGYLKENVVSCCWLCNRMKNKYSKEEYLTKIKQVYEHLNLGGRE